MNRPRLVDRLRSALRERFWTRLSGGAEGFAREISPQALEASPVSDLLYERLSEESVAAAQAALERPQLEHMGRTEEADRRRLILSFATHHHVETMLEESGMRPQMPPPEIHAMARGDVAAGGSPYYADLVVDALQVTGFVPRAGHVALDFGCSSGRVVRVLAAAYPDVAWHGCDPIEAAIDWAARHLPEVEFLQTPERPPLPYADESFDLVFAISIWSHFSERAALWWADEMARILRPGGRWLLTTQGGQTVARHASSGVRPAAQLAGILRALYREGFWFTDEFGEEGDHGIRNPDWGTAFASPEWLLSHLTPRWRVLRFSPGQAEGSQDIYVLEPG